MSDEEDVHNLQTQIESVLQEQDPTKVEDSDWLVVGEDTQLCSGLVKRIYVATRRLYSIPFDTCLISHSGIVLETTRKKAFLQEYVEGYPILIHDVTSTWDFQNPLAHEWNYGDYSWKITKNREVPIVSYNIQFVAKLLQASADRRGSYVLSGNNCHLAQEQVRLTLGMAEAGELEYGVFVKPLDVLFNPIKEMKPTFFM